MWRRNQNTVSFETRAGLGPITHTIIVMLMVAVLGLIYLTQITKTSAYSYEINDLQTRRAELISQKSDLEVESARLQALQRVSSSNVASKLDSPSSVEYARN